MLPAQITDEQRDAMLQRIVTVVAEIRQIAEVVAPAVIAAVAQLNQALEGLREAGLLDEDFKPITATEPPAAQPAPRS